jgi:hypothetical protein
MTDEQQCEKFENTQRKLREAELFLGHLIENEQQLPSGRLDQKAQDVFGFYLSAYLSAAYSVVQVLCAEIGQDRTKKFWAWYSTWIGARTFAERKLFPPIREAARKRKDRRKKTGSFMEAQRHAEVHKHGACEPSGQWFRSASCGRASATIQPMVFTSGPECRELSHLR